MNTELFIKKSRDAHSDRYDYSLSIYESHKKKVKIICKKHGVFEQAPYSHMDGVGCALCAKEKEPYNKRSLDELILLCKERYPEYDYSKSTEATLPKITAICKKHGEFSGLYRIFTKGAGCPKCYSDSRKKQKPVTKSLREKFIEKAKAKYGDQYDYSFVGDESHQKETFVCNVHDVKFQQTRKQHMKGACGCYMCAKEKIEPRSFSNTEFLERMNKLYGDDYTFVDQYINNKQWMTVVCKKHGNFQQTTAYLLKGVGCHKCRNEEQFLKRRKQFVENVHKLYGEKYTFDENEYISSTNEMSFVCKEHGVFEQSAGRLINNKIGCPECSSAVPFSKEETKIYDWIPDVFERNDRTVLNGKELDLYSEERKLAVEVNGVYWHSDKFRERDHLLDKTLKCEKLGITLLHFWDYEINKKSDIVTSMISSRLGLNQKIYARKCVIKEVSSKESKQFQIDNHIQGSAVSSINYGLYYEDELVALMTFAKSRFNKKYDWELVRYCNKLDLTVVGGASKLFNWFLKNNDGSIISYANRRYSNGNLYHLLKFKLTDSTRPNYMYFRNGVLLSRVKCQKHKLSKLLDNFDEKMSEKENMKNNGFDRIYDCGNYVFVFER